MPTIDPRDPDDSQVRQGDHRAAPGRAWETRVMGADAYVSAKEMLATFRWLFPAAAGETAWFFQGPENEYRAGIKKSRGDGTPDYPREICEGGRGLRPRMSSMSNFHNYV